MKKTWTRDKDGDLINGGWTIAQAGDNVVINGQRQRWVAFYYGWIAAYGSTLKEIKSAVARRDASWDAD